MLEANIGATNLRYRKELGKMWTYLSDMHLSKSQIDFILVRKKWKNSMLNTEAYDFFSSLGSDHRLVMAEVRLSLRKVKAQSRRVLYDWGAFKEDTGLQRKYSVEVRNRFNALCEDNDRDMEKVSLDEDVVSRRYRNLITAIAETNESMVPKREKKLRENYSADPRVSAAREHLRTAKDQYHNAPTEDSRLQVDERNGELSAAYAKAREEVLTEKISRVERAADRCKSKESWVLINEITGRKRGSSRSDPRNRP